MPDVTNPKETALTHTVNLYGGRFTGGNQSDRYLIDTLNTIYEWFTGSPHVDHETRITKLEEHMARLDVIINDLNTATNDIATELDDLRNQITAGDDAAADRLQPIADRLRSLAADPENPVPDNSPTPEPTP